MWWQGGGQDWCLSHWPLLTPSPFHLTSICLSSASGATQRRNHARKRKRIRLANFYDQNLHICILLYVLFFHCSTTLTAYHQHATVFRISVGLRSVRRRVRHASGLDGALSLPPMEKTQQTASHLVGTVRRVTQQCTQQCFRGNVNDAWRQRRTYTR